MLPTLVLVNVQSTPGHASMPSELHPGIHNHGNNDTGVGRGLLGVVGLPLSGALGLVGAMTTGLASSTGLTSGPSVRRRGRLAGQSQSLCMLP